MQVRKNEPGDGETLIPPPEFHDKSPCLDRVGNELFFNCACLMYTTSYDRPSRERNKHH